MLVSDGPFCISANCIISFLDLASRYFDRSNANTCTTSLGEPAIARGRGEQALKQGFVRRNNERFLGLSRSLVEVRN